MLFCFLTVNASVAMLVHVIHLHYFSLIAFNMNACDDKFIGHIFLASVVKHNRVALIL